MPEYYIGLMSGTSMDGIDAALVDFAKGRIQFLESHTHEWGKDIGKRLLKLSSNPLSPLSEYASLHVETARYFAAATNALLTKSRLSAEQICAIGSHGQTVYHQPDGSAAISLQIGDPSTIAETTGITTIADFRNHDIAAGGQGAPLVPAFHAAFFQSSNENRVILNIGGIANITILPAGTSARVTGFDTGPGNLLMNDWIKLHKHLAYDDQGKWASTGHYHPQLLEQLLSDPYFATSPPKSTGRETFNLRWLDKLMGNFARLPAEDMQATLLELSAISIANEINKESPECQRVLVCGGGVHNTVLMKRLVELLPDSKVESTAAANLHPDWVEAVAFAWLAKQTLNKCPGNLPAVTGASRQVILGGVYY
ncbi:MAG: anhydro-N-acetylmuramic acid kinase [Gammaproteobacteria bacterium]